MSLSSLEQDYILTFTPLSPVEGRVTEDAVIRNFYSDGIRRNVPIYERIDMGEEGIYVRESDLEPGQYPFGGNEFTSGKLLKDGQESPATVVDVHRVSLLRRLMERVTPGRKAVGAIAVRLSVEQPSRYVRI